MQKEVIAVLNEDVPAIDTINWVSWSGRGDLRDQPHAVRVVVQDGVTRTYFSRPKTNRELQADVERDELYAPYC